MWEPLPSRENMGNHRLFRVRFSDEQVQPLARTTNWNPESRHVMRLLEDRDGTLWCGTSAGLGRLERSGDAWQFQPINLGVPVSGRHHRVVQLPAHAARKDRSRQRRSPRAIEELKVASSYELGASTQSPFTWTAMYPVFVRGDAYLAARQGPEAGTEFQKILDHRGVVLNQPVGALARLGLARAYVLEGERAKARAAYEDFLALWKHADGDVPILKQANTEYSRLK